MPAKNWKAAVHDIGERLRVLSDDLDRVGRETPRRTLASNVSAARLEARNRKSRGRIFQAEDLFVDPAWDLLLDLYVAGAEQVDVSVSSLSHVAGVPPSTCLRWINHMMRRGLVEDYEDVSDARRRLIKLTDRSIQKMEEYFAGRKAAQE